MKPVNMLGKKFGRLTVIERVENNKTGRAVWKCECQCGSFIAVSSDNLQKSGPVVEKSCGCALMEFTSNIRKSHEKSGTPEHKVWIGMKSRCYNKRSRDFYKYGGRGIRVCERWENNFSAFLQDMGSRPNGKSREFSIERINNSGDYEPGNCRWATLIEQANNKRSTVFIEYLGKRQPLAQWAREIGASHQALAHRYYRGWSHDKILTIPVRKST